MEKCIKCGKETEIGLFCTSCYVPEVKMPKSIDIKQCKNCGKYFINNKWQQLTINGLESLIAKKIKGNFKEAYVDINNKEA
ncbi:MAG: NMD3-related protein, partial [Candidatus Anstonellales archaeon]